MSTQDTVTVTFSRAEYEALVESLNDAGIRHQFPEDAFATLRVLDLRSVLDRLEAAGRRSLSVA